MFQRSLHKTLALVAVAGLLNNCKGKEAAPVPGAPLEGAPAAAEAAAKPAAPPAPPPEVKVDHLAASKAALAAAKTPDDLKKALHEAFLAVDAVKAEAGKDPSELGDCPEKDALSAAKDAFANPKAEIAGTDALKAQVKAVFAEELAWVVEKGGPRSQAVVLMYSCKLYATTPEHLAKVESVVHGASSSNQIRAAWCCRFGDCRTGRVDPNDVPEAQKAVAMLKDIDAKLRQNVVGSMMDLNSLAKAPDYADFLAGLVEDRAGGNDVRQAALNALGDAKAVAQLDKIAADKAPFESDEMVRGWIKSAQEKAAKP